MQKPYTNIRGNHIQIQENLQKIEQNPQWGRRPHARRRRAVDFVQFFVNFLVFVYDFPRCLYMASVYAYMNFVYIYMICICILFVKPSCLPAQPLLKHANVRNEAMISQGCLGQQVLGRSMRGWYDCANLPGLEPSYLYDFHIIAHHIISQHDMFCFRCF